MLIKIVKTKITIKTPVIPHRQIRANDIFNYFLIIFVLPVKNKKPPMYMHEFSIKLGLYLLKSVSI